MLEQIGQLCFSLPSLSKQRVKLLFAWQLLSDFSRLLYAQSISVRWTRLLRFSSSFLAPVLSWTLPPVGFVLFPTSPPTSVLPLVWPAPLLSSFSFFLRSTVLIVPGTLAAASSSSLPHLRPLLWSHICSTVSKHQLLPVGFWIAFQYEAGLRLLEVVLSPHFEDTRISAYLWVVRSFVSPKWLWSFLQN